MVKKFKGVVILLLIFCMLPIMMGCVKGKRESVLVVFFEKETTEEQLQVIKKDIQKNKIVSDIKYITADEAWEKFKDDYIGNEELEASFFENPLADEDNFEVYVKGTELEIESLLSYIKEIEGVRKVNHFCISP